MAELGMPAMPSSCQSIDDEFSLPILTLNQPAEEDFLMFFY